MYLVRISAHALIRSYVFFGHLVFYLFGCLVIFSVIWFSIFLVHWIRSNGPAPSLGLVKKFSFNFILTNNKGILDQKFYAKKREKSTRKNSTTQNCELVFAKLNLSPTTQDKQTVSSGDLKTGHLNYGIFYLR